MYHILIEIYYIPLTLLFTGYLFHPCYNQSLDPFRSEKAQRRYFVKKNKCNVNLNKIASVQNNYMSIFTNRNWLKRIVNIMTITIYCHFIFVGFFPAGCIYYSLGYQITKLHLHRIAPYQARHGNISFI